jgi:hypothetical protein
VKTITVQQPWAAAIARYGKDIENRTWFTRYRGLIAIHAGAAYAGVEAQSTVAFNARRNYGDVRVGPRERSAVVAVVDLVGICLVRDGLGCDCGRWAIPQQYHWMLANRRALAEPVPCKGRLGLWELPDDVEAAVLAQIGVTAS